VNYSLTLKLRADTQQRQQQRPPGSSPSKEEVRQYFYRRPQFERWRVSAVRDTGTYDLVNEDESATMRGVRSIAEGPLLIVEGSTWVLVGFYRANRNDPWIWGLAGFGVGSAPPVLSDWYCLLANWQRQSAVLRSWAPVVDEEGNPQSQPGLSPDAKIRLLREDAPWVAWCIDLEVEDESEVPHLIVQNDGEDHLSINLLETRPDLYEVTALALVDGTAYLDLEIRSFPGGSEEETFVTVIVDLQSGATSDLAVAHVLSSVGVG
jgi:hypothetical protein